MMFTQDQLVTLSQNAPCCYVMCGYTIDQTRHTSSVNSRLTGRISQHVVKSRAGTEARPGCFSFPSLCFIDSLEQFKSLRGTFIRCRWANLDATLGTPHSSSSRTQPFKSTRIKACPLWQSHSRQPQAAAVEQDDFPTGLSGNAPEPDAGRPCALA